MNYGMGGQISLHADSILPGIPSADRPLQDFKEIPGLFASEMPKYGGPRIMTFMVYVTDVESGGHTIFPQLGLSVKPVQGSALYWFNLGPKMHYDSRSLHLGCPVIYGNKWITNKWIKFTAQFKKFPCEAKREHYSIFQK